MQIQTTKTLSMKKQLYRLNKEGKMLVALVQAEFKDPNWLLWKVTGQKDGAKITHAPDIINDGKASRTLEEQARLQFDSIISKLKDKGYKDTEEEAVKNRGTDASGVPKPMLALDPKKKGLSFWTENEWMVSRKIDGGRCLIGWSDGEIVAISRQGKDYGVSARFIIEELASFGVFNGMRDGEFLDGELYIHGRSLQSISGLIRKQEPMEEHGTLQYHIYDLLASGDFKRRHYRIHAELFDGVQGERFKLVSHKPANTYDEIKDMHDQFVMEGYEGAIARNVTSEYLVGGRDARMVKIKAFQDAEYKVIGYEEGKRGLIDLTYIMDAGDKGTFNAKPMGEEGCELKTNPEKFIGKMATIRYFNFTERGVPFLPVLTSIRDYE